MELKFFNPWADPVISLNRLPHWNQAGATYFVTFRLADSLPTTLLAQWKEERETWLKWNPSPWSDIQELEYHRRFSGAIEKWLDYGHGDCLLGQAAVRAAVAAVFQKFDRDRYWHHAWVLMPNHAHLLFSIKDDLPLPALLKAWKGASSRSAGLALGRRMTDGGLWQKDYFDRLIRNQEHFANCARYIRFNPAKANLSERQFTRYISDELRAVLDLD